MNPVCNIAPLVVPIAVKLIDKVFEQESQYHCCCCTCDKPATKRDTIFCTACDKTLVHSSNKSKNCLEAHHSKTRSKSTGDCKSPACSTSSKYHRSLSNGRSTHVNCSTKRSSGTQDDTLAVLARNVDKKLLDAGTKKKSSASTFKANDSARTKQSKYESASGSETVRVPTSRKISKKY